jgi:RNA polymerase sigma-70 factor, ECF subfamily
MLYDRYRPSVQRYVRALRVPDDECDDAAQEVFVAVYSSLGGYRSEAQLSTWMYRIAARHAFKLRRRRRQRDLLCSHPLWDPPEPATIDADEWTAEVHLLQKLLGRLSPKKRKVFLLSAIAGMPADEIARVVGCPENTVWSRLHHARLEMMSMARRGLA